MTKRDLFVIPLIYVCSISCLITLVLCSFFYQFIKQALKKNSSFSSNPWLNHANHEVAIPNCHKVLCICAVMGCLAYSCINALDIYYSYMYGNPETHFDNKYTKIFNTLLDFSLIIAKISTYSLFLLRLHLAFRDSIYRIKTTTYAVLICLAVIVALLLFSISIIVWLIKGDNQTKYTKYISYLEVTLLIIEAIVNIFITYLFTSILYKVIHSSMDDGEYTEYSQRSVSHSRISKVNEGPQRELVVFMVKIALCCTVSLIFWLIRDALWGYIFFFNHPKVKYFLFIRMEETTAALIDSLCLYLTFNFATILYGILCCPCHRCLYRCCINYTFSVRTSNGQNGDEEQSRDRKSSLNDPSYRRLEL